MKQAALGVLGSSILLACSASVPQDPGQPAPTVQTTCSDANKNAFGDCYPSSDIGVGARTNFSATGTSGQRIANFAFTGYPATDTTQVTPGTPTTINLAKYYNPDLKPIPGVIGGVPVKVIHLTVAAVWCGPCNEETDFISGANWTGQNPAPSASFATELAPLGVVFVQALSDGAVVGTGATITDLNSWITHHANDFTSMLDPGVQNLGVFFDAAAVPFNMNIDARSMEILSSEVGFDTQMDLTIKNQVLPWIDKNPPKQ
jgi:hypothetical protein